MRLHYDLAQLEHAHALARLDARCFTKPWPVQIYRAELTSCRSAVDRCVGTEGTELGWLVQWIVAEESHVLRVATLPDARRRGIGRTLVDRAIERAHRANCAEILLEVGSRNHGARRLYESRGFESIGLRRNYYTAPRDDAVVMRRRLGL